MVHRVLKAQTGLKEDLWPSNQTLVHKCMMRLEAECEVEQEINNILKGFQQLMLSSNNK